MISDFRARLISGSAPSSVLLSGISRDGYCWRKDWEQPHESSLSLLWKLVSANAMSSGDIKRLLGSRLVQSDAQVIHGRSFLNTTWIRAQDNGSAYFKDLVFRASLNQLNLVTSLSIASDQTIRYCPRCIDSRYHSIYFQVDAVKFCPIHEEMLLDNCRHCEKRLGRFAWTPETINAPFACPHCGSGLGSSSVINTRSFGAKINFAAFVPINCFLSGLSRANIDWPGYDLWSPNAAPLPTDESSKRISTYSIYRLLVDEELSTKPTELGGLYLVDVELDTTAISFRRIRNRYAIFLRLQRYFKRCLLKNYGVKSMELTRSALHKNGEQPYPDKPVCPYWFGYYLWINHFLLPNRGPMLMRPVIEKWPGSFSISEKAWRTFCAAAFLSYIEIAKEWNRLVVPNDGGGFVLESLLLGLERLRSDMNPMWRSWPRNIGIVRSSSDQGDVRILMVVGGALSLTLNEVEEGMPHGTSAN